MTKNQQLEILDEILARCSVNNWDGCYASAVSDQTHLNAKRFINLLDEKLFKYLKIMPDDSGDICLRWNKNKNNSFVVEMSAGEKHIWRRNVNTTKVNSGTFRFTKQISQNILNKIRKVYE